MNTAIRHPAPGRRERAPGERAFGKPKQVHLASTPASADKAACEIWIRQVGSRRQAFFRETGSHGWRSLPVLAATKALRDGRLMTAGVAKTVTSHIEESEPHPMHAGFVEQALTLNNQIDALNSAARLAA